MPAALGDRPRTIVIAATNVRCSAVAMVARRNREVPACRSGRFPFVVSGVYQDAPADPARAFTAAAVRREDLA